MDSLFGQIIQNAVIANPLIKQRISLRQSANEFLFSDRIDVAASIADELLALISHPDYPPYFRKKGRGLYCAYSILGIAALEHGDLDEAIEMLRLAGEATPSPARQTFGPNMRLPKLLLDAGHAKPVVDFLNQCRNTWLLGSCEIDLWLSQIESGNTPDFGAHLEHQL